MNATQIRHILVLGAGTMGQQIALQCACHGYRVSIVDISPEILEQGRARITGLAQEMIDQGHLSPGEVPQVLERIATTTDTAQAARDADLVSESIPEDAKLKGEVFARLDELCPPHTLFTTNSSTLVPSQIAPTSGRPARFCALHFHPPVWVANVVDIMPHPGTDPQVVALLHDFARDIGQIPIVIQQETPSYLFNAMLNGFLSPAVELAAKQVATIEEIDRSWMGVTKMEIGPFGIIDLIGLDLVYDISLRRAGLLRFVPRVRRTLDFLKGYVEQDRLGVKSGQGFYTYPDAAYQEPDFMQGVGLPKLV